MVEKNAPRKNYELIIGIDCGVSTGFAIWNVKNRCFDAIQTLKIHQAMESINELSKGFVIKVCVEDARQRKWLGQKGIEALQGAGSIKRDSGIWDDFLNDKKIDYQMIAPKNNMTKLNATSFKAITGISYRTSEHARDAAMLVFQRNY